METTRMDLLVTLDEHYLPQLRVMLTSLRLSHPGVQCRVYLLHRSIPEERLAALESGLAGWGYQLVLIRVDEAVFQDAPVTDRYPQEMYYRLLAARFLPEELKRVLYLDPDTLVINSLLPLWELELDGHLFAAAAHTGKTEIANNVNRFRLGTEGDYYNSGVLLMDLERCRNEIHTEELFDYVSNHGDELSCRTRIFSTRSMAAGCWLWTILYGTMTPEISATTWCGVWERRTWTGIMAHTAVLHFCGREKPWKKNYRRRFRVLYRHYMNLADKYLPEAGT